MDGLAAVQVVLCGWYAYMAVMAVLAALSAGPRTWQGILALLGAAAALALLVLLFWVPSLPVLSNHLTQVTFGLNLVPVVAGLVLAVAGRRQDTRLIALLVAGTSALPLILYFWHPGR